MKITKSQLREIIQKEHVQILTELGVLDKFKDFLKKAPEEAAKIGEKLKQQIMSFPELYPILMKVKAKEKLTTSDKKALSNALGDVLKISAFGATLVSGTGALVFVAPVATVLMLALEEMGVSWRPSAFEKEPTEVPRHVGITADMGGGQLVYAKGGQQK